MSILALAFGFAALRPVRAASCSAVWDEESSTCMLRWKDSVLRLPDALSGGMSADVCTQQLWCSDNGTVSRRTENGALSAALTATSRCHAGLYYDHYAGCVICPSGYYCVDDRMSICPAGTDTRDKGHSSCAVSSGYYWFYDARFGYGEAKICDMGYYCPGGYSARQHCPPGKTSVLGATSASQCY